MLQLTLYFYLLSIVIAAFVVVIVFSLAYFIFSHRKKGHDIEARKNFRYELMITSLLVIPVFSFAVLGILVILRSLR